MKMKQTLTLFSLMTLAACSYQPEKYESQLDIATEFEQSQIPENSQVLEKASEQWWKQFNDPVLLDLMDQLHRANLDIQIAGQRISQNLALLGVQKAANWPWLDAGLTSNSSKNHDADTSNDNTSLQFTASYEVDIWGKRDAENHRAEYQLQIRQEQLNSLVLQMRALLSQQYFDALALHEKIQLTEQNLQATEELFALVKRRYELGGGSGIEVDQQRSVLLNQRQLLSGLQRDYQIRQRAIAVLVGKQQLEERLFSKPLSQLDTPEVAVVQPARLLESRPDIRIAELQLKSSDAALFAAKAKRWPGLNLTAQASLADVFDDGDMSTSLIGSLMAPIFHGKQIKNQIAAAEFETQLQLHNYQKVVLQAMQEALDNLTRLAHQQEIHQINQAALDNSENLYRRAKKQYEAGATDFLNLLSAQRSLFEVRENTVNAKQAYLNAAIDTYKAMASDPVIQRDHESIIMVRHEEPSGEE